MATPATAGGGPPQAAAARRQRGSQPSPGQDAAELGHSLGVRPSSSCCSCSSASSRSGGGGEEQQPRPTLFDDDGRQRRSPSTPTFSSSYRPPPPRSRRTRLAATLAAFPWLPVCGWLAFSWDCWSTSARPSRRRRRGAGSRRCSPRAAAARPGSSRAPRPPLRWWSRPRSPPPWWAPRRAPPGPTPPRGRTGGLEEEEEQEGGQRRRRRRRRRLAPSVAVARPVLEEFLLFGPGDAAPRRIDDARSLSSSSNSRNDNGDRSRPRQALAPAAALFVAPAVGPLGLCRLEQRRRPRREFQQQHRCSNDDPAPGRRPSPEEEGLPRAEAGVRADGPRLRGLCRRLDRAGAGLRSR